MIQAWMAKAGLARERLTIRFYSDHASDAPVFDWADTAVAANPHDRLRRMAARRGWSVVDW